MERKGMKRKVALPEFFGPGEPLYEDQLGWTESEKKEARSLVSKEIFWRCIVKWRFNFSFYYVDNDTAYGIHNEEYPIVFQIMPRDNEYKYIYLQLEDDTHEEGEVLYSFYDETKMWDTIKVDGKSLEEVLERSYIMRCSA